MNNNQIQRQPRLTSQQIDYCFLHILRDPELFELARQTLRPADFSPIGQMRYLLLWSAALQAAERSGGSLPQQATEYCIAAELLSTIGNAGSEVTPETDKAVQALLAWIFELPVSALNPAYYRELIQDLIVEQTVMRELERMVTSAREIGRPLDFPEQLERTSSRIREVRLLGSQPARNLRDEWPDFQTRLQRYRGREFLGLRTGLPQLDDRTLGLRGLILLGAMPNVGKTALVLHLGVNVVRQNPVACFLFISLEMDRASLFTRIYCNLAEMDWGTLVRGDKTRRGSSGPYFTADQEKRLLGADAWIKEHGHRIRVLDRHSFGGSVTAASILREMQAFKSQAGATRAFVVIDYLQVIPIPDNARRNSDLDTDKYQMRVAQDILTGMQQGESTLLGDAVIAISETRKPATGRKHWGEDLADLMGSARLGYGADAVLLYRRIVDDEDIAGAYEDAGRGTAPTAGQLEGEGIAPIMLSLAKGRDGMRLGEWPLEYHFNRSMFRELERGQRSALPPGRRLPPPRQPQQPAPTVRRDPLDELAKYD